MSLDAFEAIAEAASRHDVKLEFINGQIGVKPVPDGDHGEIIAWLQRICMQQRPDLWLYAEQGLKIETYRSGDARPDASLAPEGTFAGQGEWAANADAVLMAVEVTSWDKDADRRDRVEKPRAYAETGIPVYLLIDRNACTLTLYSTPERGRYSDTHTADFGATVELPGLGIALKTDRLKNYVR
ncbi:Uma2 family endonuclease [Streptomyces sp. O3]